KNILLILTAFNLILCSISCKDKRAKHIENVIVITEVFGDGQKVTAVAVEYDEKIKNSSLSPDTYYVEGRTITKVYAHDSPGKEFFGKDGKYVIIELSLADTNVATFIQNGRTSTIIKPKILVKQLKAIQTSDGKTYQALPDVIENNEQINLVVDDFKQLEYKDKETGKILKYNLYVPKDYTKHNSYPLVMFIHDAGTTSTDVFTTLVQGLGAVVWATPLEQSKHECFVLAPQYSTQIVNDDSEASEYLDITINLIKELMHEYNIDWNRLYATGQSGGCMMSIAMNIKYPDFLRLLFW
ncbi:MAG: hypothetical protein LIO65_02530, partial [Odoribacter sp.]|nr:hypothetical protein [Odoribacter sp.]